MSFRPLKWLYNPPETLAPPPPAPAAERPALSEAARSSRAAKLIDRLGDLTETARYLEQIIVERTGHRGIRLELKSNPELAMSLERIYGSVPEAISVAMYGLLLDAEAGIQRAEILIDETEAPVKIDPTQMLDLQRINSVFEDALVEDATFESALPLMLRPLKGDRIIFDNLKESLGEYPILKGTQSGNSSTGEMNLPETPVDPATGQPLSYVRPSHELTVQAPDTGSDKRNTEIVLRMTQHMAGESESDLASEGRKPPPRDVDQDTSDNLDERMNVWESYYNGTFELASKVDSAYQELSQFANAYLYRPLAELQAILRMLSALKAFFHRPKLKDLRATMAAFVLPRLISQVSKYRLQIDRNLNTLTAPARALIHSLGRLVGEASRIGTDVAYLAVKGGFTGMVRSSISGQHRMPTRERIKALDTIPKGIAKLGATLAWGMREIDQQAVYVETTLFKCLDSKLAGDGNRIEVLDALNSVDSLVNITQGYIENGQKGVGMAGAGMGPGPIAQAQLTVDQFVVARSPNLPQITPPPPRANTVFERAKKRQGTDNA